MSQNIEIVFCGNTQVGKSTLINKLLGKQVSTIGRGKSETLVPIRFYHGQEDLVKKEQAKNLSKLRGTQVGFDMIENKEVFTYPIDLSFIDTSVCITDMPGFGEEKLDVNRYKSIFERADMIFYLVSDQTVNSKETIEKINQLKKFTEKLFVIYTKAFDLLRDDDDDVDYLNSLKKNVQDKFDCEMFFMSVKEENQFDVPIPILKVSGLIQIIKQHISGVISQKLYNEERNVIKKFITNLFQNKQVQIIPEKVFEKAKQNFEKDRTTRKYTNIGVAASVSVTAPAVGAGVGVIGGPAGAVAGLVVGGLISGAAQIVSIAVDKLSIQTELPVMDIKYYNQVKNYCFAGKSEFKDYFPSSFDKSYKDIIVIEADNFDLLKLMNAGISLPRMPATCKIRMECKFKQWEINKIYNITISDVFGVLYQLENIQ